MAVGGWTGVSDAEITSNLGVITITGVAFNNMPVTISGLNGLKTITSTLSDITGASANTLTQGFTHTHPPKSILLPLTVCVDKVISATITNPSTALTTTLGYFQMDM